MPKQTNSRINSNQEGIVAIVVAITLTVIMALMILAISQNSTREQRQAIDRQLSDQAFYNAESGINDVANYLYRNLATVPAIPIEKKDCLPEIPTSGGVTINYTVGDPALGNKYTCLLYDKAPKSIIYDSLSVSSPKVIPLKPVNDAGAPVQLSTLTLSWDDATDRGASISGACDFSSGPELPPSCPHGGLRFESITPAPNRDAIKDLNLSAFLLPTNGAGANISVSPLTYPDKQGIISPSHCVAPSTTGVRRCSKKLTDINRTELFVSLRSIYQPINLTITGTRVGDEAEVRFKDTQIVIDSTGKATDVLRRLQVRVPASSQYSYPGFVLQTKDSVCKVLNVNRNDDGSGTVNQVDPSGVCPPLTFP